jgi:hypothetical protein
LNNPNNGATNNQGGAFSNSNASMTAASLTITTGKKKCQNSTAIYSLTQFLVHLQDPLLIPVEVLRTAQSRACPLRIRSPLYSITELSVIPYPPSQQR